MKLSEIRAMIGSTRFWVMRKWSDDTTVVGNLSDTVFKGDEGEPVNRAVVKVRSTDVVWMKSDSTLSFMSLPKTREIIEARPGYLKFMYEDTKVTIELAVVNEEEL